MAKLTFRRIADPGAEDSYYLEPKGRFMAYDGETNAGFINFLRYPRDLSLHLDYLMVRPEYRGRGVGEVILRKFREWLHRNYAWVKYAASEVTSQKSLHLMNKVFGPPLYMSNGVRLVTLDEAMRALPVSMETNEHGGLDAEGHIDVVHWIGVGRAPKDHPWVERAAGGASGTARRGHARGRAGRNSGRVVSGRSAGSTREAVLTPHSAYDEDRLARLVRAYRAGKDVPPVVLVRPSSKSHPLVALTGSHRVAAMLRVFGQVPDRYALILDEAELDGALDPEAQKALSAYLMFQLGEDERKKGAAARWHHAYYETLLQAVATFGPEYEAAVEGQF